MPFVHYKRFLTCSQHYGRATTRTALGEVLLEVNSLGETLRQQRLGAFEATALLRTIMSEIDVAIFTFDPERRLRLINRAGETLLGRPMDKLLGKTAQELGLHACFDADDDEPLTLSFPGGSGRWGIRRSTFREQGLPHELLVLTDLSRTLREEERRAWQRLVRVLGHEMNNSLAPIKSLAASLESLLRREPLPTDWKDDASSGLNSIASRADSLSRFLQAYTRLTKLPPPQKQDIDLPRLIQRVVDLEPRLKVQILPGPKTVIRADAAQIEQVLINLLHNAVDVALETDGSVTLGWREKGNHEARRLRNWSAIEPSNCRSPRRNFGAHESRGSPGRASFAASTEIIFGVREHVRALKAATCRRTPKPSRTWDDAVPEADNSKERAEKIDKF